MSRRAEARAEVQKFRVEATEAARVEAEAEAKAAAEKVAAEKAATDSKMATLESKNQQLESKLLELEAMLHNLIKVDKHEKDKIADTIKELGERDCVCAVGENQSFSDSHEL